MKIIVTLFFLVAFSFSKRKIIIDTDFGIDDWMAIAYLVNHEDLDTMAILINGIGETHLSEGIENCLKMLTHFGKTEIPVIRGDDTPLIYSNVFPETIRKLVDDMFDIPLPEAQMKEEKRFGGAVEYLRSVFKEDTDDITIISLGGLTHMARMLEKDFIIPKKRIPLIIMGGAIEVPGNIIPLAEYYPRNKHSEWNFFIDAEAARLVFENKIFDITLYPLDITDCCPNGEKLIEKFSEFTKPAGNFVYEVLKKTEAVYPGCPLFDVVAAVGFAVRDLGAWEMRNLKVLTDFRHEEDNTGRVVEDDDAQNIKVVTDLMRFQFEHAFISLFKRIELKSLEPQQQEDSKECSKKDEKQ